MLKLFGPCMVLGIGVALVDVGVLSSMGMLVDARHTPVYGTVFAVSSTPHYLIVSQIGSRLMLFGFGSR